MHHALFLPALISAAALANPPAHWRCEVLHPYPQPPFGAEDPQYRSSGLTDVAGGVQVGVVSSGDLGYMGPAQAAMWRGTPQSMVNLHPAHTGASASYATAIAGDRQYGYAEFERPGGGGLPMFRAGYWSGSAGSWVELHEAPVPPNPPGGGEPMWPDDSSAVYAATALQQGGELRVNGQTHAALWRGTAESMVDLNPAGASYSWITAVADGEGGGGGGVQFGVVYVSGGYRAAMWHGTAASYVEFRMPGDPYTAVTCVSADGSRQGGGFSEFVEEAGMSFGRAVMWLGTPQSRIVLHPSTLLGTSVRGINAQYQVGTYEESAGPFTGSYHPGACIWSGTAGSLVKLDPFLPWGYNHAVANRVWSDGERTYIAGSAQYEGLRYAVTWVSEVDPCGPADIGSTGGAPEPDGLINNNDVIAFIDLFFARNPAADIGSQGGIPIADGTWNNNDFVVFIDHFFAGCG